MELPQDERTYLHGIENRLIRYWFYLENGLSILNEFRNLFLGIIAIYIALKLTNVLWMVIMFIPSLLILTALGYYSVHRIAKVREWVSMRFSTHYGIRSLDYQKANYELLTEIRDLTKKDVVG